MNAIDVSGLIAGYGSTPAVHSIDLTVAEGEVVALLGANGAGKTTTLMTIAGLLPALGGAIRVLGQPIRGLTVHAISRRGLAFVPEDRGLLRQLSVSDNLRLRRHRHGRSQNEVLAVFPELASLLTRQAGLLSGGEQQMLAIACALTARPQALMVDELSLGLAPIVVHRLLAQVQQIARDTGLAVLLVEQHIQAVLAIADRGYVLARGTLVQSGSADDLRADTDLLHASYLGAQAQ
jgi:branched-chain amino acid transport system ATP-binding protein